MTKKFKNCRCVHCLKYYEKLTSDHVFPKSWYPTSTPSNTEKWQIPSCSSCNSKYGKIENDLLIRFGLGINPSEHKSLGIAEKALRALDPKSGNCQKDSRRRKEKREKIFKEMLPASSFPEDSFFPNFGNKSKANLINAKAIRIPDHSIKELSIKIIRGITYIKSHHFIENNYNIDIFILEDSKVKTIIKKLITKFGVQYFRGPGIRVGRAIPHDDPLSSLYEIEIWGKIILYGIVTSKH